MKRLLTDFRLLALALMAMASMSMAAENVDEASAASMAARFMHSGRAGRPVAGRAVALDLAYVQPSAMDAQAADYYVFNASDGSAFVIVAGDDRAAGVLAHGDAALDMDRLPCNMQWMLAHYSKQMDSLRAHPEAAVNPQPAPSSTVVRPLLPSTWSQSEPYWNQCPTDHGKRCVTGCVATAMAQVMYYWKYPDELPDLPGYTMGITVPPLPPVTLDWDNMLDDYYWTYTPEQADAVATLMRYCGQASYMIYSPDGSGSYGIEQFRAMQLFGYSMTSQFMKRDDYDAATWTTKLLEDLTAGYPVLYLGSGDEGGHAFVVDGYDGHAFHINWGWAGNADGYFMLDAFSPTPTMGFNYGQEMIHDLYPFQSGASLVPYDVEVDGIGYKMHDDGLAVTALSFAGHSYHGAVTIPSQVTANGRTLPVTAIADGAFRDCNALTAVTIPSTVTAIGKSAFKNCTGLTSVVIPKSVKRIDYGAFMDCTHLSSLSLASGLQEIGYYAFAYCERLAGVTIPASVTTMGDGAFMGTGIKRADIGDGLEKVNYVAFAFCPSLTDVVIGDGVSLIERAAFYECPQLKNLSIGCAIDSIGDVAFAGCTSLSSIAMWAEWPPMVSNSDCFAENVYGQATVYVLDEFTMEGYICCEVWTDFAHYGLLDDLVTTAVGDVNADGEVNIADVNSVIQTIISGVNTDTLSDVNGDGEVKIADVNALIDLILKN